MIIKVIIGSMSHIQTLAGYKTHCDQTGDCALYQHQLQVEYQEIDSQTSHDNNSALFAGTLIFVVALLFLGAAFISGLKRLQVKLLPKLLTVLPIIIGLVVGFIGGFIISFGQCFGTTSCSSVFDNAAGLLPLASLAITIPLAITIHRKDSRLKQRLIQAHKSFWVSMSVLTAVIAGVYTVHSINHNNQRGENYKAILLRDVDEVQNHRY